jgi:hypothetical protein
MPRLLNANNIIERVQNSAELDGTSTEGDKLRTAWEQARLREYHCHARYQTLAITGEAGELELRFAWLAWWDAVCLCWETLRRLEISLLRMNSLPVVVNNQADSAD